jgi:hypothetical protein
MTRRLKLPGVTGFAHAKNLPFPAKRSGAMLPCLRKNAGKSGTSRKTQRGKLGKLNTIMTSNEALTNDRMTSTYYTDFYRSKGGWAWWMGVVGGS